MKRILSIFVLLALMTAMGLGAAAEGATLTVQGSGAVSMEADRARIYIGVRVQEKEVAAAQAAVNSRLEAIIAAMTELGVDMKDIYTNSISIYPQYDYSREDEAIVGYWANNTICVTTADVANAGAYIDAAFDAGANTLDTVEFFASDTQPASEQAMALAVEDAARKAQVLAAAAGMKLDGISSIREEAGFGYVNGPVYMAKATEEDAAVSTKVYASQLQVTASVTVVYAISPDQSAD